MLFMFSLCGGVGRGAYAVFIVRSYNLEHFHHVPVFPMQILNS